MAYEGFGDPASRLIHANKALKELTQVLRNFIKFVEYHELDKSDPRLQFQLLEMRTALKKAAGVQNG